MMLEAIRVVADGLRDATTGVNAKIAGLAGAGLLDAGDSAPPPFAAGAIVDETTNAEVARDRLPELDPVLAVSRFKPTLLEGEGVTRPGTRGTDDLAILIRYGRRSADTSAGNQDGLYTMRAVLQSLRELFKSERANDRTRNHVGVASWSKTEWPVGWDDLGDTIITDALILTLEVQDLKPYG